MDDAPPIGVSELQRDPPRYLALVKAGQRVPITRRGVLVAYLAPPPHDSEATPTEAEQS